MTFTPPTPPTLPAPAVRPTPPTPPRIDMKPFANDSGDVHDEPVDEPSDEPVDETSEQPVDEPQNFPVTRKVDDPESMARDAVANGSGALTRRTVERPDNPQQRQQNQPTPAQVEDTQSDYDRGQDVLRQFREEDARAAQQQTENPRPQTVTEQPRHFKPTINYHEGHGGVFWIGTILFVAVAGFFVVKKFLFTDKPALTKSELFADTTDRLQATVDKVKQPSPPPKVSTPVTKPATKAVVKPATKPVRPSKDDDDKGKHFEIRI